jgi:uncharacterized protein YidB (DUF937 family)
METEMGLLDSFTKGGDFGAIGDMITSNPDLMKAAGSLFDGSDSSVGGSNGLNDLLGQLSSSGLGDQVSSWLSDGGNKSVSADQLSSALNSDTLRQFAEKAGIDIDQASAALAQVLPGLIDKLSPNGKSTSSDALSSLLAGLR